MEVKRVKKSDRSLSHERKEKEKERKPESKGKTLGGGVNHQIADRLDLLEKMYEEFSKK